MTGIMACLLAISGGLVILAAQYVSRELYNY